MTDLLARFHGRKPALVASGLLVGAVCLLLVLAVMGSIDGQRDTMDRGLQQLGRYQGEIAKRQDVESRYAAFRNSLSGRPELITADNDALAAARLQSDLKLIAANNGADIRSAQILAPTSQDGFQTISAQYEISVPMGHFQQLMYAIETHTPYIFVQDADISAPELSHTASAKASASLQLHLVLQSNRWVAK